MVKVVNSFSKNIFQFLIFKVLCDYIDFSIFVDDIDNLIDSIQMVGEAYLDFDNLPNAFFAYTQMVSIYISEKFMF